MRIWTKALPLFVCLLLVLRTHSQEPSNLTRVARIDLKEASDSFRLFSGSDEDHGRRAPLFAFGVTPDGDFVALIAKQAGPWHVIRVKDWLAQRPVVEHLNVPGYGAVASSGEFSIKPQLLITQNGKYLVTVAPDPWPRGNDATISVIDLQTFQVVVTQRTFQHALEGDWQLGPEVSLRVHGLTPDRYKPLGSEQWLAFLSLPSLQILERCDYSVVFNPPNSVSVTSADFRGTPSPMCAREAQNYVARQNDPEGFQRLSLLLNPACGLESTTPDHSYAVGTCRDCRQSLFGVSCKSEKSEVYAVAFKKTVAILSHEPHKLTQVLVAPSQGKLYLFSVENAEKLTVYQISSLL